MAKTKSGPSASRKNYIAEVAIERLTGEPQDNGFQSADMRWGIETEPEARTAYEFETGNTVTEVGFIEHPEWEYSGASPDGLVGEDGAVEIKCPKSATHIETLRTGKVPRNYYAQIQWVLECTGRQWCDYVSYDPRIQDSRLTIKIIRVERYEPFLEEARAEVGGAETEVRAMVEELQQIAEGQHATTN
jgi:putative phage-type endonuclease